MNTTAATSYAESISPVEGGVLKLNVLAPENLPPVIHAAHAVTPNSDQQAAIEALLAYVSDADPVTEFFVLAGGAGTGKTFIMKEVVARCAKSFVKFAFTAHMAACS